MKCYGCGLKGRSYTKLRLKGEKSTEILLIKSLSEIIIFKIFGLENWAELQCGLAPPIFQYNNWISTEKIILMEQNVVFFVCLFVLLLVIVTEINLRNESRFSWFFSSSCWVSWLRLALIHHSSLSFFSSLFLRSASQDVASTRLDPSALRSSPTASLTTG